MWRVLIIFLILQFSFGKKIERLCPTKSGAFVGLAIDENVYDTTPGNSFAGDERRDPSGPQDWILTDAGKDGPKNSFTGKFLQVLPDDGRTYPGRSVHMKHPDELEGNSPYVSFNLHVPKDKAGWHILFVRWTGGDSIGGGDSFYLAMYKKKGKKRTLVTGERTIKPAVVPITSPIHHYAGCCYDMVTHACPCHETDPKDNSTCPNFIDTERAANFGAQCFLGPGIMQIIEAPKWYLFAGQEMGDVMDFNSEPWDATCEAEGSNTKDSGHDFPSWELEKGDYELRVFAREDGTALDAIYMAGPNAGAPSVSAIYKQGDSTICPPEKSFMVLYVSLSVVSILLVGYFTQTKPGKEQCHSLMRCFAMDRYRINLANEAVREYEGLDVIS